VKNIGVAKSNVFSNLIPIFTAITSFILLNEAMTANKIIGMIVIITGVILAQLKKKQQTI
ncbi:MAG TPA: EamA family transporter, partial [Bacteroidales bacterium]|nr:EamA family transporter [Bacteroidales bacterium]